jgi:hypothetical protein
VVPDAPAFRHDIVVPEWSVTGRVVDKATKQPIERAGVTARRATGEPGGGSSTGVRDDGGFRLALEPGHYHLHVGAPKYVAQEVSFEAGATPVERTFELVPGGSIKGTVVGAAGDPRGSAEVTAVAPDGRALRRGTKEDADAFMIEGLGAGTHLLFAFDSQRGEFAMQGGATPGDTPVSLVLTPGAAAKLSFKDANGRPLASTSVRLDLVGAGSAALGVEGRCVLSRTRTTDAAGAAEFWLPTGVVDVVAAVLEPRLRGEVKLSVPSGAPMSAEVHLIPRR